MRNAERRLPPMVLRQTFLFALVACSSGQPTPESKPDLETVEPDAEPDPEIAEPDGSESAGEGCKAGPKECCAADGAIVRFCGPIDREPNCGASSTCRGADGMCFACKCLPAGARIATPSGDVAVELLTEGDAIWSVGANGERVRSTIAGSRRMRTITAHHLLEITLADGRVIRASPAHPTAAGKPLSFLRVGGSVDGAQIISITRARYEGFLFDLAPSTASRIYWADGVRLGTTLPALGR